MTINNISLEYSLINHKNRTKLFQEAKIGLFANNLFNFSSFKGANPNTNFLGHATANGLNFFNTPMLSEVGFQVNIKF